MHVWRLRDRAAGLEMHLDFRVNGRLVGGCSRRRAPCCQSFRRHHVATAAGGWPHDLSAAPGTKHTTRARCYVSWPRRLERDRFEVREETARFCTSALKSVFEQRLARAVLCGPGSCFGKSRQPPISSPIGRALEAPLRRTRPCSAVRRPARRGPLRRPSTRAP